MSFSVEYWQSLIHREIPATQHLNFEVYELSLEGICCKADLELNKNGHNTGFAGSIYSLGITCGWVYINALLKYLKTPARVVAKNANIRYRRPITGNLIARSESNFYKEIASWPISSEPETSWTTELIIKIGDQYENDAASLKIDYHILIT